MIKKILTGLIIFLLLLQLFKFNNNTSDQHPGLVFDQYPITSELEQTMRSSCFDCHSNITKYPWYAKIQPVSFWLNHHVKEGKGKLNFSEFSAYSAKKQAHKMEEIAELVEKKEMPPNYYTALGLHPEANLSAEQRKGIADWAKQSQNLIINGSAPSHEE